MTTSQIDIDIVDSKNNWLDQSNHASSWLIDCLTQLIWWKHLIEGKQRNAFQIDCSKIGAALCGPVVSVLRFVHELIALCFFVYEITNSSVQTVVGRVAELLFVAWLRPAHSQLLQDSVHLTSHRSGSSYTCLRT